MTDILSVGRLFFLGLRSGKQWRSKQLRKGEEEKDEKSFSQESHEHPPAHVIYIPVCARLHVGKQIAWRDACLFHRSDDRDPGKLNDYVAGVLPLRGSTQTLSSDSRPPVSERTCRCVPYRPWGRILFTAGLCKAEQTVGQLISTCMFDPVQAERVTETDIRIPAKPTPHGTP